MSAFQADVVGQRAAVEDCELFDRAVEMGFKRMGVTIAGEAAVGIMRPRPLRQQSGPMPGMMPGIMGCHCFPPEAAMPLFLSRAIKATGVGPLPALFTG